ncbi:MAG: zf-HC2 domain-containing protein [Lachnospiraceae bacterium]|nr:zf-HC2 domain-containing protein [Lachnospiraceae bacterium]
MADAGRIKKECKNFEQMIPDYLEGRLSLEKSRMLIGHLRKCTDCNEEMEINYLLTEGIKRAENGETLDLKVELEKLISHTEHRIMTADRLKTALQIVGIAIVFATAVFLIFRFG